MQIAEGKNAARAGGGHRFDSTTADWSRLFNPQLPRATLARPRGTGGRPEFLPLLPFLQGKETSTVRRSCETFPILITWGNLRATRDTLPFKRRLLLLGIDSKYGGYDLR